MKKILMVFATAVLPYLAVAAGHTVTPTVTHATCFGAANGSISTSVSGGVGPFTYAWSPSGASTPTITGLAAGTYTVTVTDNSDLSTATATAVVMEPAALIVSISGSATMCSGACTSLTAVPTGGTPAYTYSWAPGGIMTAVHNPCPTTGTTYTVMVTDMNGCVGTATTSVTVISPGLSVPPSYSVCPGTCVGLNATASGGSAFSWSPATSLSSITTANPVSCPSTTTTYTVTATYAGCTATAATTVSIGGTIISGITSTNTTGCVTCDGTASIAPLGGSSPYVYLWSTGSTTPNQTSLCAGSYTVNITDAMGCSATDSVIVFANNDATANFTMVPDSANPFVFHAFNASIGYGNSYSWNFTGATPSVSTTFSPTVTYSAPGTYPVCLTVANFLCGSDTLCQALTVTGTPASCLALFNVADDTLNPDPNAHYVYNLSYGASLSYLWDFGDGATSTSATPSHVYAGTGPYLLCLTVNNGMGCTDMYCDSLISADSLNRDSGTMQFTVYNGPDYTGAMTGIENAVSSGSVSVAPNPFNELTMFTVNSKSEYTFELVDVLGKKVKEKNGVTAAQFELNREGLQNGIYLYKIFSSEGLLGVGKVIVK